MRKVPLVRWVLANFPLQEVKLVASRSIWSSSLVEMTGKPKPRRGRAGAEPHGRDLERRSPDSQLRVLQAPDVFLCSEDFLRPPHPGPPSAQGPWALDSREVGKARQGWGEGVGWSEVLLLPLPHALRRAQGCPGMGGPGRQPGESLRPPIPARPTQEWVCPPPLSYPSGLGVLGEPRGHVGPGLQYCRERYVQLIINE